MENKNQGLEKSVSAYEKVGKLLRKSSQVALVITASSAVAFYGCAPQPSDPYNSSQTVIVEKEEEKEEENEGKRSGGGVIYRPISGSHSSGYHNSSEASQSSGENYTKTPVKTTPKSGISRGVFGPGAKGGVSS